MIFVCRTKGSLFVSCPSPGLLIPVILFALATFVIAGVGLGTDPQTTWLPAIVQPGTGNEWFRGWDVLVYTAIFNICYLQVHDAVKMVIHFLFIPHSYRSREPNGPAWSCKIILCGHNKRSCCGGGAKEKSS